MSNPARRARRKALKADLTRAYSDDEAAPPEWVDLLNRIRDETAELRQVVDHETKLFVNETDIRVALRRRDRVNATLRERTAALNLLIARLNLIAPHARFTRAALDPDDLLRPLYRAARAAR